MTNLSIYAYLYLTSMPAASVWPNRWEQCKQQNLSWSIQSNPHLVKVNKKLFSLSQIKIPAGISSISWSWAEQFGILYIAIYCTAWSEV